MRYLIVLFGLLVATPASATDVISYVQSSGLMKACQTDKATANAYVAGFMDSQRFMNSVVLKPRAISGPICIPDTTDLHTVRSAVCSYAGRHHQTRDAAASVIISLALQEAFPCR